MAPISIAVQNIRGNTIYADLKIVLAQLEFYTLVLHDNKFKAKLKKVDIIIIKETSILFAKLLNYISNIFATIHNNAIAFRSISTILISDLTQLPYVTRFPIFKSSVWKLFYPLFLCQSHHQQDQSEFFDILQNIHMKNIIKNIWKKLQLKHQQFNPNKLIDILFNTTNIVRYCEIANKIDYLICNTLPTA